MTDLLKTFGGKRAFVRLLRSRACGAIGAYSSFDGWPTGRVGRLVFVCKGNICRSPYAEAFASKLGLPAKSAGLEAAPGSPANPSAVVVAESRAVSLSAHRAQLLSGMRLHDDDLLLVFEPSHARAVRFLLPAHGQNIRLLGMFMRPCFPYIHDPYGNSVDYFRACFSRIEEGIAGVASLMDRHGHR